MNPAQWMGPAFPAFLARTGATPFDTDLAELGCQPPTAFALGEHCVGRLCARAVPHKFFASVRARATARKRPFDVEATFSREIDVLLMHTPPSGTLHLSEGAVWQFLWIVVPQPGWPGGQSIMTAPGGWCALKNWMLHWSVAPQ